MLRRSSEIEAATKRDAVEAAIIDLMPERFFLPEDAWPRINQYKSGNFGFSYLGFSLYANGYNSHSYSTDYPRGLVYFNPETETVFGLGIFFRPAKPDVPNLHIIAPQGKAWQVEIGEFSDRVQSAIPGANIYVRHLIKGEVSAPKRQLALSEAGFEPIGKNPWLDAAPQEDEHENSGRIFVLGRILKERPARFDLKDWAGSWNEKLVSIPGYEDVMHPNKVWMAENRFGNFLERNGLEYVLVPYAPEYQEMARIIVQGHFHDLDNAEKAIGSTAADYENLIKADIDIVPGLHMFIGLLRKSNEHARFAPVSFFGFEEIGRSNAQKMAGGYATITRRNSEVVNSLIDVPMIGQGDDIAEHTGLMKGFSAIAAYAMRQVMKKLYAERGIKVIDLGGSETHDLALGKQHLGGHPRETFWVVRTANSVPRTDLEILK